jgi:hypothetical protein
MLLQHAIDSIAGTFYTQVMFADFELQAHRLVERESARDRRRAWEHLCDPAARVLRRRDRRGADLARHLGAHSAFLQHAVLCLPVRHVLCVHGQADAGSSRERGGPYASRQSSGISRCCPPVEVPIRWICSRAPG